MTLKQDAPGVIKRAERFQVILIGEGIIVGVVSGLAVLLYRLALEYADTWLGYIFEYVKGNALLTAGWFAALLAMAVTVAVLVKYEPMISGSGIPQVEGEIAGKIETKWYRVLLSKFAGGFLCMLGGLALGREGPSIQIGAMAGKGVSKRLDRGKTEEKFLITCGASAGLAAAFHAPLAGVMFSLEEIHKNFSVSLLVSVMTASVTSDCLCSLILGSDSVFRFEIAGAIPIQHYWMIIILGIILGFAGAFYNWFTLKVQELLRKVKCAGGTVKIAIPFLIAGVIGFIYPQVLGSGHDLVESLAGAGMSLGSIAVIFALRFVFSSICFGSGAPGGIFFPLLVLGAYIGGAYAVLCSEFAGLEEIYAGNIITLAMAGYFAAIVRAPLTGIILIFEMTGSLNQMLSLSLISITAYITATLLKSKPIYESLLERLLSNRNESIYDGEDVKGEKVLMNHAVQQGSEPEGKTIGEIAWPRRCLLVAVQRGSEELIPKGSTKLYAGDIIVTMTDDRDAAVTREKMNEICRSI